MSLRPYFLQNPPSWGCAGATLLVLREALTGWDALREELAEAAGVQPQGLPDAALAGASAAQAVVDAVCALHQAGVIRHAQFSILP